MPQGDKSAYTDKQKRKAAHIEEGYEESGLSEKEAGRRAWATVNAMDHGGKKSGSGRGKRAHVNMCTRAIGHIDSVRDPFERKNFRDQIAARV